MLLCCCCCWITGVTCVAASADYILEAPDGTRYAAKIMPRGEVTSITIEDLSIQWNYDNGAYIRVSFGLIALGGLWFMWMSWILDISILTVAAAACLAYYVVTKFQ